MIYRPSADLVAANAALVHFLRRKGLPLTAAAEGATQREGQAPAGPGRGAEDRPDTPDRREEEVDAGDGAKNEE